MSNHVYKKIVSEVFSLPEPVLFFPSAAISADCQVYYNNHCTLPFTLLFKDYTRGLHVQTHYLDSV